jgi:hypothetical protein
LLLGGCGKDSPSRPETGKDLSSFVGKWADLSSAPETAHRQCCFYDSTAENPCGPDTLILRADSSMAFTSVLDEPSLYWIDGDTLYRFKGMNREDTLKFAFTLDHDTLNFPQAPLCDHNPIPSHYRKVPD